MLIRSRSRSRHLSPSSSAWRRPVLTAVINKSEAVKKAKKEANDRELSDKEKKKLTEEEKEYENRRKQIQEKLIKFATRVPVFMYLTDYRERTLKDVITQLNAAVYKFKRYEDASLAYIGVNKHEGQDIGLYDTVLSSGDYSATFENLTEYV